MIKRGPYCRGAGAQILEALKDGELTTAQIRAKCPLAAASCLQQLLWNMVNRGKIAKEGMRYNAKYRLV